MRTILFDSRGTLRSGWRALVFVFVFAFVSSILAIVVIKGAEATGLDLDGSSPPTFVLNAVVSLISALGLGWLCARYLEDLPFRSLGAAFTQNWHKHFGIGAVLGSATLAIAIFTAYMGGGLRFTLNSSSAPGEIARSLAISLLVFGAAAAFEEILFRGYVLQTFARSGLAWLAIILTAVFFGAVHMGNPNSGIISSTNTILAGIWFGIAYLKTRDLWFVWGLHLMWNWTQGAIFGVEVSGITSVISAPLFREADSGPVWLTGLEYGIEGGIVCTVALVISGLLIYKLPGLEPDPELLEMTTQNFQAGRDPA